MKLKQLRNRKDLPPEFSLEKYLPTYSFEIGDWLVNLEQRVLARYLLSRPEYDSDGDATSLCNSLLDAPILLGQGFEDDGGYDKLVHPSSVQDLSLRDFFYCDSRYQNDEEKEYGEKFHAIEAGGGNAYDHAMFDIPYYKLPGRSSLGNVLVDVDLHATDEKIQSDMAQWLKKTRQEIGIVAPKKNFTRRDFDEWAKGAILPYLDLTAWASLNGYEITQQVLGLALFPDDVDVSLAERIRKVTAPTAKAMARSVFTNALRSQALQECAEQNPVNSIPG